MTERRRGITIKVAKLLAVTLTLSLTFSFGWNTYEMYNGHDLEDSVNLDTIQVTHIDTFSVPQTITFYDTIGVYKVHYDTLVVEPQEELLPPRPWGSEGRPH